MSKKYPKKIPPPSEPVIKEFSDQQIAQEFMQQYRDLCNQFHLQLVAYPVWKKSMDSGDYRLAIQFSTEKIL